MLTVNLSTGTSLKVLFTSETPLTVSQVWDRIQQSTTIPRDNFYILHNGRLANNLDTLSTGSAIITPRFLGGKGGFGSMLRAIGAQIEKTTNREACRDLSGRRLRDINEEKRLKQWMEKQSERQDEAAERKKRKLEKLRAEPKHEFKDHKYDEERSVMTERVADAVEEGFKAAAAASGIKRTSESQPPNIKRKKIFDDFSDSSDDDSNESQSEKSIVKKESSVDSSSVPADEKSESIADSEKPSVSDEKPEDSSDNPIKRESESNNYEGIPSEEKIDSSRKDTVEKVKLAVSN